MNARSGDTHLHGSVGVVNNGDAPITIHMPCPGLESCPYHHAPLGERDAKEENEFCLDTGIRAGTRARTLLSELKARHKDLRWKGIGSIGRMWRNRSIEYIDGSTSLRIYPNRFSEIYGWCIFFFGCLFLIFFAISLIIVTKPMNLERGAVTLAALVFGILSIWFSSEHLISPERAARKLMKAEKELQA